MNHIETLKLALEALEEISSQYMSLTKKGCMALAAIREALAEQPAQEGCVRCNTPKKCALYGCSPLTWPAEQPAQQQEPVAWVDLENWLTGTAWPDDVFSENQLNGWTPLYTTPPAAPVQVQTDWEAVAADQAMTIALLKSEAAAQPAQEEIQRLRALVRAQQITIDKLEARQEPVAVVKALPMGHNQTDMHYAECQHLPVGTLLYTSPPAAPASQEEIQRLSALVRAQQITIEKLEAQSESK